MSKNPKVTIALAFLLTFLLGMGAGYLLRGGLQHVPERIDTSDRIAAEYGPDAAERGEGDVRRGRLAPEPPEERRSREYNGDRMHRNGDRPVEQRERQERYQSGEQIDRDRRDGDSQPGNGDPRWRSDDNGERPDYSRFRNRLKTELGLSDETADELFEVLREHRQAIREEMEGKRERMSEVFREMKVELEEELSEILTEEQWETWQEMFTPRDDRWRQGREGDTGSQRNRDNRYRDRD
ncbi:hypothetical protein QA596_01665 [Balneolales bacterium ANBcel1]|nr:hypothetical protein [Balneolales bacterium ANBcel1]